MAGPFGISFVPGAQDPNGNGNGDGGTGRTGARRSPVQEAVKILSLRLPKFYGSQSLAPGLLLNSPGGMGQPGARGNVTAQAFAQMAGLPPTMAPPMAPPMAPTPIAPMIPPSGGSGGGTDTFGGWNQRERDMNRPGGSVGGSGGLWTGVPRDATGNPTFGIPPAQTPPPRFVPGSGAPGGQGVNDLNFGTLPPVTGLPAENSVLSPEYRAWSEANPENPSAWTPEPAPEPAAVESPWEQPGRNETLARKYLEMLDGQRREA